MGNMSYCRFRNTVPELEDCAEHIDDDSIPAEEKRARSRLIDLCREIVNTADSLGVE